MKPTNFVWLTAKTLITYWLWAIIIPPTIFCMLLIALLPAHKRYKNKLFFALSSLICRILTKTLFIPMKISGTMPDTKKEQFVIVMNHSSNLDAFFIDGLMHKTPRLWMAKDFVAHIPIVGFIFKRMHILVNRDRGSGAARALIRAIKLAKKFSSNLMLFPEGTRSYEEKLLEFNHGFVRAARTLGRKILPIAIKGANKIFVKDSLLINSNACKIELVIGNPMTSHFYESEGDFALRIKNWFASPDI
ncbi:1-acyl-sn-glycerol-3-phosphate acyltransferase [Candidatus Babeliales bacterium]|nr:1-acyl-sn-glycerol-3-phosphate acyltransferase [Candidatus Babeliales bacterium]